MSDSHFFRYTDLPSLIHILKNRQLTLLDPKTWDDRNDSSFIAQYKDKCNLKTVLALCFSQASETYHHWRIFAPSSSGVRISLNEHHLRNSIAATNGVQLRAVEYVKIDSIRETGVKRGDLPFVKRYPYHPESEIRLLWESATEIRESFPLNIDLKAITQITLSPWLHPELAESVKSLINSIDGCEKLAIRKTTLISNAEWLKHGSAAK